MTDAANRRRDESGLTLIELMIAISLGVLVLVLVLGSLTLALRTGDNGLAAGKANDKLSLAMTEIKKQVVSAYVLFNPATEGSKAGSAIPAGFSLRLLSPSTGQPRCDQWRLAGTVLEDRSWIDGNATSATPWATVATGVVNPADQPPFALAATTEYGGRLLNVNLVVSASTTLGSNTTTQVQASFTAANAEFFPPSHTQFCTPVPRP